MQKNDMSVRHFFNASLIALVFSFLLSIPLALFAQQLNKVDPLGGSRKLIAENELSLFYLQNDGINSKTVRVTYDFDNNQFSQLNARESNTGNVAGSLQGGTDIASGIFLGESFGEAVAYGYRSGGGNSGKATFSVDLQYYMEGTARAVTVAPNSFEAGDLFVGRELDPLPQTQLAAGNFTGGAEEELFVVYTAADQTLKVQLYQLDAELVSDNEVNISSFLLDSYSTPSFIFSNFKFLNQMVDATALDVDSDLRDELVVAYWRANALMVDVFDVDELNQIQLRYSTKVFDSKVNYCFPDDNTDFDFNSLTIKVVGGELVKEFPGEEFVVGMVFNESCCSGNNNQGLYLLPLREERGMLTFPNWCVEDPAYTVRKEFYTDRGAFARDEPNSISLAVGDLDGDLDDEIVLGHIDVQIFNFSKGQDDGPRNTFEMTKKATFREDKFSEWDTRGKVLDNFVAVGNIDPLADEFGNDFRAEIVLGMQRAIYDEFGSLERQEFRLEVWEVPEDGVAGGVDYEKTDIRSSVEGVFPVEGNIDIRRFSIGLVDLDGGGFQLGVPRRTTFNQVLNPLVVLNAPPTHYDILGSTAYDVSNLYGDDAPQDDDHFSAVFEKTDSETTSFQTAFTSDWSVSAGIGPGLSKGGFDLGAKLTATYGEQFSKVSTSSRTITIQESRTAKLDDVLLAYLVDYDIYEYPVYRPGQDQVVGHVLVVIPSEAQRTFIGARSPTIDYVVDHQHGNIFSYNARINEFTTLSGEAYRFTGQEISKNTQKGSFSLEWSEEVENTIGKEVTGQITLGVDVGGAFKGIGLGASLEGSYEFSLLKIQTSKYQQSVSMEGFLGRGETNTIQGDYPYTIRPVIYWDENGSLVLDYIVEILDGEGGSFWKTFYNSYDPAFLLLEPFKLEKGIEAPGNYNKADRYRTRDIRFTERPEEGGTTTIRARIHNYGLLGTPVGEEVEVCFFYLDPEGSNELEPIGCKTIINAFQGRLDALDREIVEMPWNIPDLLGPDAKIVVHIDPNNKLPDEVHDYPNGNGISNNIGWTCLFNPACSLPDNELQIAPALATPTRERILVNNGLKVGPNPVRGWTWLMLDGQWSGELQIQLVNALGQPVKRMEAVAVTGDDRIPLNLGNLETGIYQLIVSDGRQMGRVSVFVID